VPGEKHSLVVSKPKRETVLFRSFSNLKVLSNFYAAPLTYDGQTFPTAEHAYQYRKAVFHKQWGTASLIKSASSPRDAKFIAKRIIQIPTWHEYKPEFMSDILMAKSRQCPEFRKALIGTGEKHLLHNIETDSYWGCGEDLHGTNMLGVLLEDLRQTLKFQLPPPCPSNNVRNCTPPAPRLSDKPKAVQQPKETLKPNNIMVIGNSNARGMAQRICALNLDATSVVYPGGRLRRITSRMRHIKTKHDPDFVVLMAGDIETTERLSADTICKDMTDLVTETKRTFPLSRIIVSGVTSKGSSIRQHKIAELNRYLEEMQADDRLVSFVDNRNARLYDNIHLTPGSKDHLSRKIAGLVRRFF
jgi:ribA/ribD-fused uncharacterized protein